MLVQNAPYNRIYSIALNQEAVKTFGISEFSSQLHIPGDQMYLTVDILTSSLFTLAIT